ncbi:MAG: prepilin peptidase [Terracidiphilus sp.]|jgi:leader peptidase (prepilin peptidase)/N-methyltransferase
MIRILGTIFAGLLGLAFGSFLNVCLSRWPAGESIVRPRSHCRQCNRTLAWWENVPLLSWLALRGRCRTCRAWIGWRYPLVELAVGGLWALQVWNNLDQLSMGDLATWYLPQLIHRPELLISAIGSAVFPWLLIALAVLDAESLWLPDWLTLPGIMLGFICTIVRTRLMLEVSLLSKPPVMPGALDCVLAILAAAALILLIRWVYWLIRHREGIGLGDAKLMALLAAWLGLPGALLAFGIGVVLGALAAIVMLAIPSARRESKSWAMSKLPLGTFLCIGGIVSSLWGWPILEAYQRWAGF